MAVKTGSDHGWKSVKPQCIKNVKNFL